MSDQQYSEIDTYLNLCSMHLLYRYLPNEGQEEFIDSLNENPLRIIAKDESFALNSIIDFYAYQDYFLYKPLNNHQKVYFVKKQDVPKALKNVKTSIKNGFVTFHSFHLN